MAPLKLQTGASVQWVGGLPLSVGGGVNNVATGRINCRQAAGLRGGLLSSKRNSSRKASDLSALEEISGGRLEEA